MHDDDRMTTRRSMRDVIAELVKHDRRDDKISRRF